jgi:D-3-phosphoglycerate dehydrogenase
MTQVFITDYIDEPGLEYGVLGDKVSIESNIDTEVLLVWHEYIDAQYLDQFPKIKGVVRYGVGFDNIDLEEIKKRKLVFCNTPDYGTDEVSDTALAMMLSLLRGVFAYDSFSRNYSNTWQENTINNLRRVSGLTLGVVGAGRIGTALMRKAKALGMNIMFYDPYKESGYEKAIGVSRCYDLSEFLAQCDVVSMHTPLTSETQAMVDESFIDGMKQGSVLINSSRGEVVKDLDVIYKALKLEKLSAVALDVLPDEPPIDCELIRAWRSHDKELAHRIIINPHTSYYTQESYIEMRTKAAENAKRILNGVRPLNIIIDNDQY